MGRRKVEKGRSRGSEEFTRWLANSAYSVDRTAKALGLKPVSIYALRNGYWKPSLELARDIEVLTHDMVPIVAWSMPPSKPRRRKKLARKIKME